MTLERKLQRRVREWSKMAATFRESEIECRCANDEHEADLNQAWAEALERCVNNLGEDLTPLSSATTLRLTSVR
jgi:hypothetical protein